MQLQLLLVKVVCDSLMKLHIETLFDNLKRKYDDLFSFQDIPNPSNLYFRRYFV